MSEQEKFEKIYLQINEPLSKEKVKKIIYKCIDNEAYLYYGERNPIFFNQEFEDYYNVLVINNNKQDNTAMDYEKKDKLYEYLFNEWKNQIVSLSDEEIIELRIKGKLSMCFNTLHELFKKYGNQISFKDFKKMLTKEPSEEEFKRIFNNLRIANNKHSFWMSQGEQFNYIKSNDLSPNYTIDKDGDQRLYVSIQRDELIDFIEEFIKKCKDKGIQYYLKYSNTMTRREDDFVIYTKNENLLDYIEILEEIKNNSTKKYKIYDPPMLTKTINGWIGYGTEPSIKNNKNEPYSYNSLRAVIIRKAMIETMNTWIEKLKRTITNQELLLIINDYYDNYIYKTYKNNEKINEKEVKDLIFKTYALLFHDLLQEEKNFGDDITVASTKIQNGSLTEKINIYKNKLYLSILNSILSENEDFINDLRNNIIKFSKEKGIDESFIEVDRKNKLKEYYENRQRAKNAKH